MALLRIGTESFECAKDETVLDALQRHGVNVPHSCRAGACQSCLMQAAEGTVPPRAQIGLKDTLKAQGYFLACMCTPETELRVRLAGDDVRVAATIADIADIGGAVLRVRLHPDQPLNHRAGQYLTLFRADGLARSYSIVSRPEAGVLELHVRCIPGGHMSGWLKTEARAGDRVKVQGPSGDCFYTPGKPEQPLLLAGTGTGLAPLAGILMDALAHGHTGPITLYHGARNPAGLYFVEQLRDFASTYPNVTYHPCVLDGAQAGQFAGALDALVLKRHPKPSRERIFVCGDPAFVQGLKKKLFMAGAALREIFADAFVPTAKPANMQACN